MMKNRLGSRQFATTLGIELHLQPHPAAAHARGVAEGNHVFLNLYDDFLGLERSLHLLRHEIHHVLQQRQGRVVPTGVMHGHLVSDAYDLELEAEESALNEFLGSHVLAELAATRGMQPSAPVLQCFTEVGARRVNTSQELSVKGQIILRLIPSGETRLRHMATASHGYLFASESELLAGIHQGLHGTRTLLLPALELKVSPHLLYAMHLDELERIANLGQHPGETRGDLRLRTALLRQRLWPEAELKMGDDFIEQSGQLQHPCLTSRSLDDRIAVFELVDGSQTAITLNPMLQREAASFATDRAQDTLDFVDYYTFYMARLTDPEPAPGNAAKRFRAATALVESLTPIAFDYLECPRLDPASTVEELPSVLKSWSGQGNRLGFPRVSAALAHFAQFAGLEGAVGDAATEMINRHMDRIQMLWLERTPDRVRYSQTGSHLEYLYQTPEGILTLVLAGDGSLTIGSYEPGARSVAGSTHGDDDQTA